MLIHHLAKYQLVQWISIDRNHPDVVCVHPHQSEFGHGDVQVVPGAHPELLLVRLRPVAWTLQRPPPGLAVAAAVHPGLPLSVRLLLPLGVALRRLGAALHRPQVVGLGRRALAASVASAARPQGGAGLPGHQHLAAGGRHRGRGGRLEGAQRGVRADVRPGAVQRDPLLQRGGHFVQFFKVLGQPRAEHRRGDLEVVVGVGVCVGVSGARGGGGGRAPGADDGAVLSHVDAAVDVGVAVVEGGGRARALGVGDAVLARGAALVLAVHHQLDPPLSAANLETHALSQGKS